MKILAVEDNPADVEILRELLGPQGASFELENAKTLGSAGDVLAGGRTEFILLDLGLPDSQGIDTLRAVRNTSPSLPIVVLTGFDDEETGVLALHEGAQDYLVKGQITGASLARSIRYASERNRVEQELIRKNMDLDAMNEEILATDEELRQNLDELGKKEQELVRSEKKFRNLFEKIAEGFALYEIVCDDKGVPCDYRFLDINPAYAQMTGMVRKDIVGKAVTEVRPDEDPQLLRTYGGVASSGQPVHFDTYSPTLGRNYDVYAYTPGEQQVAVLFTDITRHRQMTEALRQAHAELEQRVRERTQDLNVAVDALETERKRLYNVLETLPVYICLLDEDYRMPFANRYFRETFGESHGKRCYDFLFSLDKPCENCESYKVMKTRARHHWYWTGPNGRDYDIYDFPFTDSDGSFNILEMGIDITDRNRAEAELRKAHDELEVRVDERTAELALTNARLETEAVERRKAEAENLRAREEWERTFNTVPDLIALIDTNYHIFRVNQAMATRLGTTPEACIGHMCHEAVHNSPVPPEFCPHNLTCKDGKEHVAEVHEDRLGGDFIVSTTPLRDESGRLTGSVHVARDITDRKHAERELREKNRALNTANEELSAIHEELRQANDDLLNNNTHLNALNQELSATQEELTQNVEELTRGEQELKRSEGNLQEALAEKEILLSEIHHRVKNNLTAFISLLSLEGSYEESPAGMALKKDLQNRARTMALIHETLYKTHQYAEVDMEVYLSTLVEQVVTSYQSLPSVRTIVEAKGITLDLARATPTGLIVNEIVTNALKYAFADRGASRRQDPEEPATVIVALSKNAGMYTLQVSDNGAGLPPGLDPATTKSLGLKLVNFLAKHQLRAKIEVNTEKGTEFVFRFRE